MRTAVSGRVLLLLGVGLTASSTELAGQACGTGHLTLNATASLTLPSTFGIQGLDASGDGGLLLWSAGGELLTVDPDRQLSVRMLPDTIHPLGVRALPGGGYEILDAWTGREYEALPGRPVSSKPIVLRRPGEVFERALWREDGWLVGILDTDARQYVVRHHRPDGEVVLFRSAVADSVRVIPRFMLTETATGLLLTQGSAPFAMFRVHPGSARIDTLAPLLSATAMPPIPRDSLHLWRAVSTVSLDCALLLTVSDLTSDRRLLVRYGADDQVDRVTPLQAPLGLMAAIPGARTVLGARRAGELELVWYDWRWIREPSSVGH